MNILLIYAHPDKDSFLMKIRERFISEAKAAGHTVFLRDLLEMNFDPVLGYNDLNHIRAGNVANDILQEQEYVQKSDAIVVIYPIWYMSMPAIIKGYFDRVLTKGFAFKFKDDTVIGLLENKNVYLISTAGLKKELFDTMYLIENFNHIVDYGIFEFCGMEVKRHDYYWSIPFLSDKEKKQILTEVAQIVRSI